MATGVRAGGPDKVSVRRSELAAATLRTLAELGYARTSLREIAQNSEFSHGVLHYYFRDKVDLLMHCVREYKAVCVTRYDRVVADASSLEELEQGFFAKLRETLLGEAHLHRLWYDLRSQSMFEPSFRADIEAIDLSLERMIWRVVGRACELSGATCALDPPAMYAVFDGLFHAALLRTLAGDGRAPDDLETAVRRLLAVALVPA